MHTWFRRLFERPSPKKKNEPIKINTTGKLRCQEVVELVTDYLEGALLPEKRDQVDEHLVGCDGCTNYIEQVKMTIGMLRDLSQKPEFPETKEELLSIFREWKH
jgi:predicted anti-sigma-YlaC factor YlaD